jgi:GNAT superfamily N-acetyltransferase
VSDAPLDAADLEPEDTKAREALARYRLEIVDEATSAAFAAAYGALAAEFAPRGEIERREVVLDWLAHRDRRLDGLAWRYLLLAAWDGDVLAGARDCHVTVDADRAECVIYLAHTLVLPPHRRGGLASLLRAAPITIARRVTAGVTGAELLLAAEMEPADLAAQDTLVRLVAYGRAGFRAVSPARLPYCQPDFRDLAATGAEARPLPLLAVVRRIGHEEASALPPALGEAFVRHLYAVFGTHCRASDLARPREHALAAVRAAAADLPLLALPRHLDDRERLAPLLREAVLPYHLPELW